MKYSSNQSIVSFRDLPLKERLLRKGAAAGIVANQQLNRYYSLIDCAPFPRLNRAEATFLSHLLAHANPPEKIGSFKKLILDTLELQELSGDPLPCHLLIDLSSLKQRLEAISEFSAIALWESFEEYWYLAARDDSVTLEDLGLINHGSLTRLLTYRITVEGKEAALKLQDKINCEIFAAIAELQLEVQVEHSLEEEEK